MNHTLPNSMLVKIIFYSEYRAAVDLERNHLFREEQKKKFIPDVLDLQGWGRSL